MWNAARKFLQRRREAYEVYFTAEPGDAKKKARELTEHCREERRIIAVGGDGTINEVLDGISLNCPVIFGMLPAGFENDLGRSLGLPKSRAKLIRSVLGTGRVEKLDYGVLSCGCECCHNRRFLGSTGIGFDAAVCRELLHSRLKAEMHRLRCGKLTYLLMGIRELAFTKPVRGYLILDGTQRVEFNHILFVSAHIQPYEGGGYCFAPDADPRDGKLSVCVVSARSRFRLIPVMLQARHRNMRACAGVRFYECREAHIHTERPLAVHTDGESCRMQTDIDVRCVERQLNILR